MPKVTSSAIQPLSGVFAIDKPSGAITMKLLNSMKELLETSPYFAVPDDPNQRYGHKKRRRGWGKISGRGRAVGVVKLGQGGTLDPLASGVLAVGLNDGTKKLQGFLHGTKEYRATGLLGCSTDSYDSDGRRVRSAPFQHVTREKVEAVLDQFRGEIKQLPPIYSAIKMDGKPLYDYARQNLPLPRAIEKRDCTIYNLELINFKQGHDHSWKGSEREVTDAERETMERLERLVAENATSASASTSDASAGTSTEEAHIVTSSGPETVAPTEQANEALPPAFEITMTVSSGTYVRSIIHDIGQALGSAAHVVELVRTRQCGYALDPAATSTVEGQDDTSIPLHGVVPWSVIEDGLTVLHATAPHAAKGEVKPESTAENEEPKAHLPWEDAILQALNQE